MSIKYPESLFGADGRTAPFKREADRRRDTGRIWTQSPRGISSPGPKIPIKMCGYRVQMGLRFAYPCGGGDSRAGRAALHRDAIQLCKGAISRLRVV